MRHKIIPFWYLFRISTVMMGLRLVGFVSAAALTLLGVLSLDTSWTTATEWWSEGEVNVFLRVKSDNVWWDVDNLKEYFTKCPISYCRSKYRFILSFWWELIVSSYRNKSALHKSASSSFVRNSLNINQSEWFPTSFLILNLLVKSIDIFSAFTLVFNLDHHMFCQLTSYDS